MPSRRRIAVYSTAGVLGIVASVLVSNYLDRVHALEYTRSTSITETTVTVDATRFRAYVDDAFEILASCGNEGPTLQLRAGWCLQARRAERGQPITRMDTLVTGAVLRIAGDPWFREYSATTLGSIKERLRVSCAAGSELVEGELRAEYLDGLVAHERFAPRFEQELITASQDLGIVMNLQKEDEK